MKTVVITGVSRGIGKALARAFLKRGDRVIGTSTSGKADTKDPNLTVVRLDLSDPSSITAAVDAVTATAPRIDILMNNAGIGLDETNNQIDMAILRKTLEVNLIGLIDFTEQLLPHILRGGQIVNTSSVMGSLTADIGDTVLDSPSYRISKTAVNMYTKTLASRLKQEEITVSSVHPGWVKTDMGGEGATREPEDAAEHIVKLATTPHPTGFFWFDNKKFAW